MGNTGSSTIIWLDIYLRALAQTLVFQTFKLKPGIGISSGCFSLHLSNNRDLWSLYLQGGSSEVKLFFLLFIVSSQL